LLETSKSERFRAEVFLVRANASAKEAAACLDRADSSVLEQALAWIEQALAWIEQEFGRSELALASLALIPAHPEVCFFERQPCCQPSSARYERDGLRLDEAAIDCDFGCCSD
jgi:hypothetical protein